jgi:pimeloyl-ACP methyl ester carboxylesterase
VALELSYDEQGSGEPIVVLHGLFGSKTNWRSIARRLAATHRVITVDARNHGGSPWADSMSYPEMAEDVLALIDRLGLGAPTVLGHSMGGKTAMMLALEQPDRVARLVVADVAPVPYADRLSPFAEAMRTSDVLHAASREEVRQRLSLSVPDAGVVGFLLQNLEVRNEHFDWRVNLPAIMAAIPALSSFPRDLTGLRYDGPVLVIAGGRSDYVSGDDGEQFRPMFPDVQVEVIAPAGHWVHADRPEEFVAAVTRHLA